MPTFDDRVHTAASPAAVWKLLYDPARFTEWWVGVGSVEPDIGDAVPGVDASGYTMYPDGYPDFPMPQTLRTDHHNQQVTISCLVSDLQFVWRLSPAADGRGTDIAVHVDIPESEAARLAAQREIIHGSLLRLAELARITH
ncbi:SRPBCC family protein [Nocardia sp. NPDC004722]